MCPQATKVPVFRSQITVIMKSLVFLLLTSAAVLAAPAGSGSGSAFDYSGSGSGPAFDFSGSGSDRAFDFSGSGSAYDFSGSGNAYDFSGSGDFSGLLRVQTFGLGRQTFGLGFAERSNGTFFKPNRRHTNPNF